VGQARTARDLQLRTGRRRERADAVRTDARTGSWSRSPASGRRRDHRSPTPGGPGRLGVRRRRPRAGLPDPGRYRGRRRRRRGRLTYLIAACTHLRTAESGDVVPDALERLEIVFARAGGVTDDAWVQPLVTGQGKAEGDELGTAVVGMLAKHRRAQDESAVPRHCTAQLLGQFLDLGSAVAGI